MSASSISMATESLAPMIQKLSWVGRTPGEAPRFSVVEEPQVGVHQSDALLVTGINHNLVGSRARRGRDVLHSALQTETRGGSNVRNGSAVFWEFTSRCLQAMSCKFLNKRIYSERRCFWKRCVVFTRLARSMLSLKGKKASELTATACRELTQFFFSVSDRGSGTSSYFDFQTARSGPCPNNGYFIYPQGLYRDMTLVGRVYCGNY